MFKNKLTLVFILMVLGFSCIGNVDNTDTKKMDFEEIENIVIISE